MGVLGGPPPSLSRVSARKWLFVPGLIALTLTMASPAAAFPNPPWADAMWAHFPGTGGLDTTTSMNYVRDGFSGGYTSFSSNPSSAAAAMGSSYALNDAIWWMAGHAGPGYIQTYGSLSQQWSQINTTSSIASCASPNTCLSSYTFSQMHHIRLMGFMGCNSGDLIGGDSLPKRANQSLGVDSSIGWTVELGFVAQSNHWAQKMASYAMSDKIVRNVSEAAAAATTYLWTTYGQYWGYDHYVLFGGSTYVQPPAYGS